MSQIKQLLRLHSQGMPVKRIARTLGISRNTVKGYLRKVAEGKESIEALLALDNPVLEAHFHAGNPAYKDPRYAHLVSNLPYYEKELRRTGVTRELLWEEYIAGCPGGYSYTQFCFHLRQRLASITPTMVLEHRAGEKLFIDFAGKTLSYIDRDTGEEISCPVLVACLPFSDYAFAMAVPSQGTGDFLHGLECCLRHLGGVPQALVPDNLKAAVERADRYEPTINRTMEEFANHYGTVVVPARARRPQDKASVENQVKNVYTRVFAKLRNLRFFDVASLNTAIAERMAAHNQTRMQKKAYCRLERFRNAEKPLLSPLPAEGFQVVRYAKRKVGQNNYVLVEGHSYSVPFHYIGQHVQVAYTRSVVRIYAEGKQVATHVRKFGGGYTAVKEHLSSQHQYYLGRSPDYFIARAEKLCPELPKLETSAIEDVYDEIELIGFPVSATMFDLARSGYRGDAPAGDLLCREGSVIRMVGDFVADKTVRTKRGNYMKFGTFFDVNGDFFDTVHFPPSLARYPLLGNGLYLMEGKVTVDFGCPALEVARCGKMPLKKDPRSE